MFVWLGILAGRAGDALGVVLEKFTIDALFGVCRFLIRLVNQGFVSSLVVGRL